MKLVVASAVAFIVAGLTSLASSQTVTTFSVPGAMHTRAFGINPSGDIVGIYVSGNVFRGVLWKESDLVQIDYPGAAVTSAIKINPQGDIVGWYGFAITPPFHGYVLRNGEYLSFDVPDSRCSTRSAFSFAPAHRCTWRSSHRDTGSGLVNPSRRVFV